MRQSWETMTSVSAGHIIQTPTQPVGSGRPQRESNPGPPHQESRALPQSHRAPLKVSSQSNKGKLNIYLSAYTLETKFMEPFLNLPGTRRKDPDTVGNTLLHVLNTVEITFYMFWVRSKSDFYIF